MLAGCELKWDLVYSFCCEIGIEDLCDNRENSVEEE